MEWISWLYCSSIICNGGRAEGMGDNLDSNMRHLYTFACEPLHTTVTFSPTLQYCCCSIQNDTKKSYWPTTVLGCTFRRDIIINASRLKPAHHSICFHAAQNLRLYGSRQAIQNHVYFHAHIPHTLYPPLKWKNSDSYPKTVTIWILFVTSRSITIIFWAKDFIQFV